MPIFERPPLESLVRSSDRWTPVYLEHGRLEVDDSAVKWIGADGSVIRIPVATVSAILLGPGTTITHDAIKACAESNLAICWVGDDNMRFYSFGVASTSSCDNARKQAEFHVNIERRTMVARRMFSKRFPGVPVHLKTIDEMRLLEGTRVKRMYDELGCKYGVTWRGRKYTPGCFNLSDDINKAISATNHSLYAICLSIICSTGYLPQLGFVHLAGVNAFVHDVADMYKAELTLDSSFRAMLIKSGSISENAIENMKEAIEAGGYLKRISQDIDGLFS
jgi:CRISPR-associated protein Cas1